MHDSTRCNLSVPGLDDKPAALCLTIGDPTGIGPEIAVKFLHAWSQLPTHVRANLIVLGDMANLRWTAGQLGIVLPSSALWRAVDTQSNPAKSSGQVAYDALEQAVTLIHQGHARALVTGPLSKENLQAAGLNFSGHTEILEALANRFYPESDYQSDMLFVYRQFRMLLLTRHVPLREVSAALTVPGVVRSLTSLLTFLQAYGGVPRPRLGVLGVNPHAGELDGTEEAQVLRPALARVAEQFGFGQEPPMAADAAFRGFDINRMAYDAYVAAYHDQGLIPFKLVAGLQAVNVTIGLPFLRTSVSHGTAPDIVGQGVADPASLMAAYESACQLTGLPAPLWQTESVTGHSDAAEMRSGFAL